MKKTNFLLAALLCAGLAKSQNKGLRFDGVNDYVDCGTNYNAGTIRTMECWAKFNSLSGSQEIISKSTGSQGIELLLYNSNLSVYCMNGTTWSFISYPASNLSTGVWYHLAFSWNGTKESMQLYVNGKAVGSRTDNGDINLSGVSNPGSLRLGDWSDASPRPFNGDLDEVRIWTTQRTATEIKTGMYGTVATNSTGLASYYKLNEGAGFSTINSSTSAAAVASSNGSLLNGVAWFSPSPVQGNENALHFDGVNDHVVAPANSAYDFTTGTVECWVRTENLVGNTCIIGNRLDPTTRYSFHISSTAIGLWNNSTYKTVPFTVTAGQWYHLAFVCVPGNTTIYVNGNAIGTTGNGVGTATGLPLHIGMTSTGGTAEQFNGSIDEVRIWNVARTPAEIQANMNVSLTGNEANLVALFNFNQGLPGGNNAGLVTAMDASSLQNHGRLNNFGLNGSTSNWISHSTALANPAPVITSFTPGAAPLGTQVTISGNNFNTTAANNIVYFGATKATVTAASTTSLTVTAPVGASYQNISVLNKAYNLLGSAAMPFLTTFADNSFTFRPKADVAVGTSPTPLAVTDLDGDGKADVMTADATSNTVSVLRNTSTGSTITTAAPMSFSLSTQPTGLITGDVDGDGLQDMIVSSSYGNTVSVFRNTSVPGSVSFATRVDISLPNGPQTAAIGDLDGDGKQDLSFINSGNSNITVLRNLSSVGTVSFAAAENFLTGTGPYYIAIGDLDGDGKQDLVSVSPNLSKASVLRNTSVIGALSFDANVDFATGANPVCVMLGDVDGDGSADLLTVNNGSGSASVLRNSSVPGTPSFDAKADFTTGANPYSIAMGDVNGDGKVDVAVANYDNANVSVLINTSAPGAISMAAKTDYVTGNGPRTVALSDLDGDGRPDISTANLLGNTVSILQNVTPAVLPLTGLVLQANRTAAVVHLMWTTLTETNTATFTIERSSDSRNFKGLGSVSAAGNSISKLQYSFDDRQCITGTSYYRIKQTDQDGKYIYSAVVMLSGTEQETVTVAVSPQPVHQCMRVRISGATSGSVFAVYDAGGRRVIFEPVRTEESTLELNRSGLKSGIYFYQFTNAQNAVSAKGKIVVN